MSDGDMNDGPLPSPEQPANHGGFPRVPETGAPQAEAPGPPPAAPPVPPATEPTPVAAAGTWPQSPANPGAPTLPGPGAPAGYGTVPASYQAPPAGYAPPAPGHGAGGWEPPTVVPPSASGVPGGYGSVPPGYGPPPHLYGAGGAAPAPAGAKKRHAAPLALGAFLLLVAAAGGVGIGHAVWSGGSGAASASPSGGTGGTQTPSGGSSGNGSSSSGGSSSSATGGPSDVSSIASGVDPGLVDINTSLGYQGAQAAGTGMVLTSSGEVLTNNHVINGATTINATDLGNGHTYSATVIGYDRSRDVAVLQLRGASNLKTVSLGNSSDAKVGMQIVGIGNAGGAGGTPSSAGGTITSLNQSITASDEGDGTSEQLTGLIQVNADIQPGDSGGPLVSTSGKVLGIDTAASSGTTFQTPTGAADEGFAIPINEALPVAQQIESGSGSSTVYIGRTAFLGVEVSSSSPGAGSFGAFGFGQGGGGSGSTASGATVAQVLSGSPAENAGLAAGDVITALGSHTVTSPQALTQAVTLYHPGDRVTLQWTNQSGQQQSGTVTLASGPPQ